MSLFIFNKISVSIMWRRLAFFPIFIKYRYQLCGEDMISSSEVHDKGDPFHAIQLSVNFWSKVYSKSSFPNEWYHSSPRFPLHCAMRPQ